VPQAPVSARLKLPLKEGSLRFAVLGDTGTGGREQYELARQMASVHLEFPFEFVIMVGDNIIGADTPGDMAAKFSIPYKALLDLGIPFRAVLGNHDSPTQRFYKPFNMAGERYYTFRAAKAGPFEPKGGGVRFFALETDYLDKPQIEWLERELSSSNSEWKIAYFHHPLYYSGAAVRQVRPQRRLLRTRSRLRADQAAEGRHRLLGVGCGRKAARRRSSRPLASYRQGFRP
jgi:hypothetical protein